jgi:large subunit ribosomal protein L25
MDLSVQKREKFGKAVKSLRREGFIPAELYGHGLENLHLTVPAKDFIKVWKQAGSNTVVNVLLEKKKQPALIYEVRKNYLSGDIEHVDFYAVRMDEKIKAKVPLEFIGEAPAVKEKSGILNKAMAEIEVEALPADLPRSFEVDISSLDDINKSIYVKDIKVPKGVSITVDPETVIVTVKPPLAEEKVEAPVEVSAVKVEGEEEKAERAAEKAKGEKVTPPKEEAPKKA